MRDKLNIKLLFQASCVGDWERTSFMDVGRSNRKSWRTLDEPDKWCLHTTQ